MDDWDIMRTFQLCARIFEFLVQIPIFKKKCRNGLHVDHYARGFWLFTGWKTRIWARLKAWMIGALCELSTYVLWFCLNLRFEKNGKCSLLLLSHLQPSPCKLLTLNKTYSLLPSAGQNSELSRKQVWKTYRCVEYYDDVTLWGNPCESVSERKYRAGNL